MLDAKQQISIKLQRTHSLVSFDADTQQDVGKHREDEGEPLHTNGVAHSMLYSPGK